jgi:hypothetical protein
MDLGIVRGFEGWLAPLVLPLKSIPTELMRGQGGVPSGAVPLGC